MTVLFFSRTYLYNKYLLTRAINLYESRVLEIQGDDYIFDCVWNTLTASRPSSIEVPQIAFVALLHSRERITGIFLRYICKEPLADGIAIWINEQRYDYGLDYASCPPVEYTSKTLTYGFTFEIPKDFLDFKIEEENTSVKVALTKRGEIISPEVIPNPTNHKVSRDGDVQKQFVYPWSKEYFSTSIKFARELNEGQEE